MPPLQQLGLSALLLFGLSPLLPGTAIAAPEDTSVIFPRYPALSPDGKTLVFSYQGDLWSAPSDGGQDARRLTVHPAYDGTAFFSPDGKQIAFNSSRYGRNEVFVMPAGGGTARRLTFYSGGSTLRGWSSGGQQILLTSVRENQRRGPAFYTIGAGSKPGRPKLLLSLRDIASGEMSPDGKHLVFARGSNDWPRRGYHGAANADIWVYTPATKSFQQITSFDGQDLWPHWLPDSKTIVYVSERDGTYNLFRQSTAAGAKPIQITRYKGDGVRFPSVSGNGSRVAFEVGDRIASMSLAVPAAAPRPVALTVAADDKVNQTEVKTVTDGASSLAAAPDGEQLAFVINGDIFVTDRTGGKATRLTDDPARDDDMAWSADGEKLIYVSNRDGHQEIYSVSSTDKEEPLLSRTLKRATTRMTNNPEPKRNLQFSPDGKKIAYVRGRGDLVVADTSGKNERVVLAGTSMGDFAWSPDSQWFACSRQDEEFNSEILLLPSDGSKPPVNISKHPRNDISPAWSPDGTKVFWASERLDRQYDLYYVYLKKEDDERTPDEWTRLRDKKRPRGTRPAGTVEPPPAAGGASPAAPGVPPRRRRSAQEEAGLSQPPVPTSPEPPKPDPEPASATPTASSPTAARPAAATLRVTVDFDRIDERVRRLTSLPGDEGGLVTAPGTEGRTLIAFRSAAARTPELSLIDFQDGSFASSTPRRIAAGGASSLQWTRDGKTLYYLSGGGSIASAAPAGGAVPRPIAFRARYSYDRRALQLATFDEAWTTLNEQFYDPKFHGADWAALQKKYRPLAAAASDPADFYDSIRLMMGHLNSSHIGITPPAAEEGDEGGTSGSSVPTGALGVVWDESYFGPGLKIAHVLRDSPAARTASLLKAGEIVTAIGGTTLNADTNPDELLADTVGERTPLQVTGIDGKSREVILQPTTYAAVRDLMYDEWVEQSREATHKLSGGKLAYLHIRSMDKGSQDRFEQGLYAEAHGRGALLIDVRDNGGGSTADYLLTMLTIPRHAYTIPRGGEPGYPQDRLPLYPWQKPAALLINQNSYSNAEIFAHAFKAIDRGPIVGVPTFGAVISTGGRRLLDGSQIRTPGRGWYLVKTGVNQEHTGAQPDQRVVQTPADEIAGRDPQLAAAVKLLLPRAATGAFPAPQTAR
jgi:Tol biopolymer transport system component/C-terminal processing protease CtpA/Prc